MERAVFDTDFFWCYIFGSFRSERVLGSRERAFFNESFLQVTNNQEIREEGGWIGIFVKFVISQTYRMIIHDIYQL